MWSTYSSNTITEKQLHTTAKWTFEELATMAKHKYGNYLNQSINHKIIRVA